MGKISEAKEAQEAASEQLKDDIVYNAKQLYEVGCEGFNLDTAGSAGDADFYATLLAVQEIKRFAPDMAIEVGMASEMVLGMHGEITFKDTRLAGLFPHQQVALVEEAGADIFGPAVNIETTESTPWNLARAVTFVKETSKVSQIPVHVNVGMGVGGTPMTQVPPICLSYLDQRF